MIWLAVYNLSTVQSLIPHSVSTETYRDVRDTMGKFIYAGGWSQFHCKFGSSESDIVIQETQRCQTKRKTQQTSILNQGNNTSLTLLAAACLHPSLSLFPVV